MLRTPFTALVGCSVPVQQAGMGGVARGRLAAAVADAGGLGMVSGVFIPPATLAAHLAALRRQTTGVFGVNFLLPFLDRDAVATAAHMARVVEFFYGAPDAELVTLVHRGGALACWQIGSRAEALAAVAAGCDLIVAQGIEAGGHVRGQSGLLPLLSAVLEVCPVPVLAAGGIGTGRALAAALAAGAAGVRVGTRFVAATESDAHPTYIAALLAAEAEDTVLTEVFSATWPNAPHRVLQSSVVAAQAYPDAVVGEWATDTLRRPLPRFASAPPTRETTGTIAAMALHAGESVGAVRRVQPAAAILQELIAEAAPLLRRSW